MYTYIHIYSNVLPVDETFDDGLSVCRWERNGENEKNIIILFFIVFVLCLYRRAAAATVGRLFSYSRHSARNYVSPGA